ncbi:MAG: O-antigen ligase family protein [Thermodesulfobacteriota bacterium]
MGRLLISFIAFVAIALLLGMMAAEYSPKMLILATVGLAIFIGAFINSQLGLYILILSMLLSPEFIASPTAGKELGRGVTLRLDDFLLTIIGLSWLAKSAIHKEMGLFLRTPLNRPIFFYLVVCLVSTGIGIMTGRADLKTGFFFVLKYFEYFLVYFMIVNHLETREQMHRFLFCMFLTCFIVSLYGISEIPGGGRVSAPFEGEIGEPNTFGGYLVFIGAVAAGLLDKTRDARAKKALIVLLMVIFPPLLFTQSRSSYLAAVPAMLALGYMSEKRMVVLILMLLGLALSPFFLPAQVKERIMYTFKQPQESGQLEVGGVKLDTSTSARLTSWGDALRDWTNHPILGYGVTGYSFIDAQFPRVLVETGILGFSAFIYLLVSVFKITWLNLKLLKASADRGLVIGFLAGYIGLLFHAIGANTFIIVRIMEPFWLLTGIIVILPKLQGAGAVTNEAKPVAKLHLPGIQRYKKFL